MNARDEILARVRTALGDGPSEDVVPPRGYRSTGSHAPGSDEALDLLVDRLEDYRAVVEAVSSADLPSAIARVLAESGSVVVPDGVPPEWVDALTSVGLEVRTDRPGAPLATGDLDTVGAVLTTGDLDTVGAVLTACRVAIAETGTIVLDAGADQGRRVITLVPDRHVCVVRRDQVVESVPEAIAILQATRPQTWISGPSATSDIELSRVEGVHGPRTLHVLIVA